MYETYEQETDLKWLIYRVLRKWRCIIMCALIVAFVLGFGTLLIGVLQVQNPKYIAEKEAKYQSDYETWVAAGPEYETQLTQKTEALEKQKENTENSILMNMDYLHVFRSDFEMQVQSEPEVTELLLNAYSAYLTEGNLRKAVNKGLSNKLKTRFFNEILVTSVDYSGSKITYTIKHPEEEQCQKITDLIRTALIKQQEEISRTVAAHALTFTISPAYETVDLEVLEKQENNQKKTADLEAAVQGLNQTYLSWQTSEPQQIDELPDIVKKAAKWFLIGGIAGGVAVATMVAFYALLSGKLLNPEDMRKRLSLHIIGVLPGKRVKKPFAFVSRWFAKFGGITATPEDFERLAKMIGTSIKSDLSARVDAADRKKIAFTGTVSDEELANVISALGMDTSYNLICALDVLTNAESIEKLVAADYVVLVEKQEESTLADITKEMEALRAWNKTVLGAVVLNTDAVM